MHRGRLLALLAALAVALPALGLWIQFQPADAGADRSISTDRASAALSAIVRRGLADGEIPLSRLWRSFSHVEPITGGVPTRTRLAVAETLGGSASPDILGLEYGFARRAVTPNGIRLWMIPGQGVMCLVRVERVATTCTSMRSVSRQGLFLQTRRTSGPEAEPTFVTIGIVPDWATGVSLRAGDAPVTFPVSDNAFDFAATRSIKVLHLTH